MKKILINILYVTSLTVIILGNASAQTKTIGVLVFEPPKDFMLIESEDSLTYQKSDISIKAFTKLTISATYKSNGSPQKDHKPAWDNIMSSGLVKKVVGTNEKDYPGGWKLIENIFMFTEDNLEYMGVYSTYSNSIYTFNILHQATSNEFQEASNRFYNSFKFDGLNGFSDSPKPPVGDSPISFNSKSSESRIVSGEELKYDQFVFKPTKGWKEEAFDDFVKYTNPNPEPGTFCSYSVTLSTDSVGTPLENFEDHWQKYVSSYQPSPDGKPETEKVNKELTWVWGSFSFSQNGIEGVGSLTTYSNASKSMSVITVSNSTACKKPLQKFLDSVSVYNPNKKPGFWETLGKTVTESIEETAKENQNRSGTNSGENSSGRISNTGNNGIVGAWSKSGASIASRVNSSGSYVGDASMSSDTQYIFRADGTYEYYKIHLSSSFSVLIVKEGTYSISGDKITLRPNKSSAAYPPGWKLIRDQYLEVETFKWFIGAAPYNGYPRNCLQFSNNDGSSYPWDILRPNN